VKCKKSISNFILLTPLVHYGGTMIKIDLNQIQKEKSQKSFIISSILFGIVIFMTIYSRGQTTLTLSPSVPVLTSDVKPKIKIDEKNENSCRVLAKDLAMKKYQSCLAEVNAEKIEELKKEYQNQLNNLKKKYENQILEIKKGTSQSLHQQNKQNRNTEPEISEEPTINPIIEESAPSSKESESKIESHPMEVENLDIEEPIITLKPATELKKLEKKSSAKALSIQPKSLSKKKQLETNKIPKKDITSISSSRTLVPNKKPPGEKGVKGIAKTLPTKKIKIETKPASEIVTENELTQSAAIEESELEKVQLTQYPSSEINGTTGEIESLQVLQEKSNDTYSTEFQSDQQ
jgi:hypothetical protein